MEHFLLNIALVSPFFLTLAILTIAIVFAPAVKNEIAPATGHDHVTGLAATATATTLLDPPITDLWASPLALYRTNVITTCGTSI